MARNRNPGGITTMTTDLDLPELRPYLDGADHVDVKSATSSAGFREVVARSLSWQPAWLKALFAARVLLARLIRLDEPSAPRGREIRPEDVSFTPGDTMAFFTVADGAKDRFLVAAARLTRLAARHVTTMPHATMRLLGRLDELGPTRISDLARADRCSQPTMSTLVQRLEDAGWVRRDPDPADSRASLIGLTQDGRRELDTARQQAAAAISVRLNHLSAPD